MEKFKRGITLGLVLTLILSLLPMNIVIGENNEEESKIHIKSTYPFNNQENIEINPLIEFNFDKKVELRDRSKIKISSDGDKFAVDLDKDVFMSFENNKLKIDVNSLDREGKFNLRKDTAYKITLEAGALGLKDKKNKTDDILNGEENLYFITGSHKATANRGLVIEKYSSNFLGSDKINYMNLTNLDSNGEIYIHFNKNIQWNKYDYENIKSDKDALKYFKLYEKPKAYVRDKIYLYDEDKKPVPKEDELIDIESVEIVKDKTGKNTNTLKIKPKNPFLNLNEYKIVLQNHLDNEVSKGDKGILISFEDDVLKGNITQNIWTKASNDKSTPNWDRESSAEQIIEDKNAPNKNYYVIHGAPKYSKEIPIIIYIDKEVIVKPSHMNSLSNIKLYESYKNSNIANNLEKFHNYKIEYYMDKGTKKTKVSLYPKEELGAGKEYTLNISKDIFVTRGNISLDDINLRFAVEGDRNDDAGIYEANLILDGKVMTNELIDDYLYFKRFEDLKVDEDGKIEVSGEEVKSIYTNERKHKLGFEFKGYNFSEEVESIELIKIEDYVPKDEGERLYYEKKLREEQQDDNPDKQPIKISSRSVSFNSVNRITGTFDEKTLIELSKAKGLGKYEVRIIFKDKASKQSKASNGNNLIAVSNGSRGSYINNTLSGCRKAPIAIDRHVRPNSINVNPNNLDHIEITFEDIKDDVSNQFIKGIPQSKKDSFKVMDIDNNIDIRDKNKKLYSKISKGKITYFIPIDRSLLEEDTNYEVTIPEDIVRCKFDFDKHHNIEDTWKFKTRGKSSGTKVYQGSVPKDYDASYPVLIEGTGLTSGLSVHFERVDDPSVRYPADRVVFKSSNTNYKDRLYVYLPKTRKVPVGTYNIIISNGNLETSYKYGVFSVVENGKYVPNEDYRQTDDNLKEIIKTSKNELLIEARHANSTLDIDSIIGEEVLTRDIKCEDSFISILDTKSKWANVKLTNIRKETINSPMTISLGRAEPQLRDNLKKKLRGESIKSEFIIVGGENYTASKLNLTIPYKQSNGNNLKLLRYDEDTRRVNEIRLYDRNINKTDNTVNIELINALPSERVTKGIFVVVE